VTEDLGALLASLRVLALGSGSDFPLLFWYADEELNRLLGLETLEESVFAVLPLPVRPGTAGLDDSFSPCSPLAGPLVKKAAFQRSRQTLRFPIVEEVHLSALVREEPRPDAHALASAGWDESIPAGEAVTLPPPVPELLAADLLDVFRQRQSSFGRFSGRQPLALAQFATLLTFASASQGYSSDLKRGDGTPALTRLLAFVHNVEGVPRGAYAYDGRRHCLWEIARRDFSLFLQEHYRLQNYNVAEAAALLVIAGRPERVLEACGNRGYRILNAEVGLVAQSIYLASTALKISCGAALGFDNLFLNEALGLGGSDERSLLFLLVGPGWQYNASFAAHLF
jgi:SagB-type dehydrogenase family enzyme